MSRDYKPPQFPETFFDNGTSFKVRLDSDKYVEGSEASGVVSFSLSRRTCPMSVYARLIGYEIIYWRTRCQTSNGSSITHHHADSQCCDEKFLLMQISEDSLPGDYSYPFTFIVPKGIPGTYGFENDPEDCQANGSVTYNLSIELEPFQRKMNGVMGRESCPITIMQEVRSKMEYNLVGKEAKKIRSWLCFNQGSMELKCNFSKNIFNADEPAIMDIRMDTSECKTGVNKITAILKRKITLKEHEIDSKVFEHDIIKLKLPGVKAGVSDSKGN